jgi:hypothetical protein
MTDRIMKVNAYTTFTLLDGQVEGHEFRERALATLDVRTPRQNPEAITLEVELDTSQSSTLPVHAESVSLDPDEARALADELRECADRVSANQNAAEED